MVLGAGLAGGANASGLFGAVLRADNVRRSASSGACSGLEEGDTGLLVVGEVTEGGGGAMGAKPSLAASGERVCGILHTQTR